MLSDKTGRLRPPRSLFRNLELRVALLHSVEADSSAVRGRIFKELPMNERNLARRTALVRRLYTRDPHVNNERRHKFSVGNVVMLIPASRFKRPKDDPFRGGFQIIRLLPRDGGSFHYRLQELAGGRECIVAEESILAEAI